MRYRRHFFAATAVVATLCGCHATSNSSAAADNDVAAQESGAATFKIDRIPLPGVGRGDYITADSDGGRLYVTESAVVHILDLASLKQVGEVTGLKASHGVALDKPSGHAFVTDGDSNAVVEFDPATGKRLKTIGAGEKPDAILRDPASGMVLAFNGDSATVSVIDPSKGSVVKTIKLPAGPEFPQADGKGTVWVNLEDGNEIAQLDTNAMKLARTIPLPGCDGPAPLSFDPTNRVLFSGCANRVMTVTDADTGKVITTVPIGGDPDGIVFDQALGRIYVANRDGGWTIIHQEDKDHYVVDQTLKIDEYAKTVALDPATHRVFSSTADLVWPKATPGKKLLPDAKPGTFRLLVVSPE